MTIKTEPYRLHVDALVWASPTRTDGNDALAAVVSQARRLQAEHTSHEARFALGRVLAFADGYTSV